MKNLQLNDNYYLITDIFSNDISLGFTLANIEPDSAKACAKLAASLNQPFNYAFMNQIHSDKVHVIKGSGIYRGDGLFTSEKKLVLIVKTADCLPLVFYSEKLSVIGVVHMGWRSGQGGILENIPYELSGFKVLAGIGLRQCCYQVGKEFLDYSRVSKFVSLREKDYYFDPIAFAKNELFRLGLLENNFFDINICSKCDQQNFPSYRRTGLPNRTLTFIIKK